MNEDDIISAFMGDAEPPAPPLPFDRPLPEGWSREYPQMDDQHISNKINRFLEKLEHYLAHRARTGIEQIHHMPGHERVIIIKIYGDPKLYFVFFDGITAAWHN